jgi:hypothetical protein
MARPSKKLFAVIILAVFILPYMVASPAFCAPPGQVNQIPEANIPPGKIGDSGYVVPIPEVKIGNITGRPNKSQDETSAKPPSDSKKDAGETTTSKFGPRKDPTSISGIPTQAPMAPDVTQGGKTAAKTPPAPSLEKLKPNSKISPPVVHDNTPSAVQSNRERVEALPQKGTSEDFSISKEEIKRSPETKDVAEDINNQKLRTGSEDSKAQQFAGESPPPKKELLDGTAPTIPALLENHFAKSSPKLEKLDSASLSGKQEEITLNQGRNPAGGQPQKSNNVITKKSVPEEGLAQDLTKDLQKNEVDSGKPALGMKKESFMESISGLNTEQDTNSQDIESKDQTKISGLVPPETAEAEGTVADKLVSHDQTKQDIPKRFASPLGAEFATSKEARDYLREISPILEELSLLMAKSPNLTVADYDPSDPGAAIFPKEVFIRMDALKRQLQILDSKTFAIIPPPKFQDFHAMVRESISRTFRASDDMIRYFNDQSDENLKRVQDHLMRAKQLIQITRAPQN